MPPLLLCLLWESAVDLSVDLWVFLLYFWENRFYYFIFLVLLRSPQLGDLCCFKQSHQLFHCHRHWNRSLIIARYLITTASKQADVRLLKRKHLFPAGLLFLPSFLPFSHHNINYSPNLALGAVPHADESQRAGVLEVGFLSSMPSLWTGLLIIWTLSSAKLKYVLI